MFWAFFRDFECDLRVWTNLVTRFSCPPLVSLKFKIFPAHQKKLIISRMDFIAFFWKELSYIFRNYSKLNPESPFLKVRYSE